MLALVNFMKWLYVIAILDIFFIILCVLWAVKCYKDIRYLNRRRDDDT